MSARDYSRGTSVSNLDELDEYGLLTERLEWALLVADSQRFKIDSGTPEQHANGVETRQDMPRHGVPHPVALRGRGTRVRHVGALTERAAAVVDSSPVVQVGRQSAVAALGRGEDARPARSVNAPSLASLYCVGMLLTISAAQGAWGLACFILAYALWVVRRTRRAVRREA